MRRRDVSLHFAELHRQDNKNGLHKKKTSGVGSLFQVDGTGFEPVTSAVWKQRSKPTELTFKFEQKGQNGIGKDRNDDKKVAIRLL